MDLTKLTRDYVTKPLMKSKSGRYFIEIPSKDDLYELYITQNENPDTIAEYFGISVGTLQSWFKTYEIKKDFKLRWERMKKTNLERYGVESPSELQEVKDKMKKTNLERYGVETYSSTQEYKDRYSKTCLERYGTTSPLKNESIKNKAKQTCLEKYGVANPLSNNVIREKISETNLERYGCSNPFSSNEIKEKIKKTNIERYGVEYGLQSDKIKEKIKNTNLEKYGVVNPTQCKDIQNKIKQTCLEKYGVGNPMKLQDVQDKLKQTCLEKYGVEHPLQNKDILNKVIKTTNDRFKKDSFSRININDNFLDILQNKEKLENFIQENNVINGEHLSHIMNISKSCSNRYLKMHDLHKMFDYSQSMQEKELKDYVSLYYKTENNTRKYLDGKEIDIYISELKLGIEFNGDYWHNEFSKDKMYHQEKSQLAEEKGIFIYHIFEYEWIEKRKQILNQLNNLLHINHDKVYARKCDIREVDNETKHIFLDSNHLQGDDTSSIKLGLYYENKLVSLMTFCKPRFNKNYEWELSRFCSLAGCNVVGGASKLFKHFIEKYQPKSIISYSNYAHTKGNLYQMLGFEFKELSSPNYVWRNSNMILTRYQCQKHKLLEQGFEGVSETDIMHKRGFYRIFDCGNKVWAWNK